MAHAYSMIAGSQTCHSLSKVLRESSIWIIKLIVYTQMRDRFKSCSNDATSFMEGESWLFDGSLIKKDDIFHDLLANNSLDDTVLEILEVVFKSFYILCERLLIDHLPGGIHDQPTEEYRNQVKSVPKTKKEILPS